MKKFLSIILCAILVFCLAACRNSGSNNNVPVQKKTVNIVTLKGPTGMGMVGLMKDSASDYNDYNITLTANPTDIVGFIADGSVDIAACPLNLAATLYKKTNGGIKLVAINTLGVLYIVENGKTVENISSLKGKTIVASGQGATPEYILNYLLERNGIDPEKDIDIEWKSEHSEVATLIASGKADIALLPEPNVTAVTMQNKDVRTAIDMTEEWKNVSDSQLAMGCIIARTEFVDKNAESLNIFLEEYKKSVDTVNENSDDVCSLIAEKGIVPSATVAKKAIPNCNIVCMTGNDMKLTASDNFSVLFKADPKSVGGELPNDGIYYIAQ